MARVLLPLVSEATCEYTADTVTSCLTRILGPLDGAKFSALLLDHVLTACHQLLTTQRGPHRYLRKYSHLLREVQLPYVFESAISNLTDRKLIGVCNFACVMNARVYLVLL